ncbi:SubName: Full=Uncharacterized protein {ECO:0000313/EMBL:CCA70990.1} [Serendipita indica DSM 11827]|uniref:C2H2-type domain-containing protein n=1 Tax=Serendipita indica (strain DSM 11827) TaxID=1109443 RepID=G4TI47_SERID|nr:SubName: Full=Uncharacterized protein {ECO:0000313/EMBL:CCA70990.1} [Serendipita indica DSM 11827]CCA70990.1 hypothetical protein PIIN_04923 [Serendipita indica DSM 11827]
MSQFNSVHYGSLDGVLEFKIPEAANSSNQDESPSTPDFEDPSDASTSFYGHKPANPKYPKGPKLSSDKVEEELLAFAGSDGPMSAALNSLFSDARWRSQLKPIPLNMLRGEPLRVKERDSSGQNWWPCQLGCPGGIPVNGHGPIKQATKVTDHIDWHLGIRRYACVHCNKKFPLKQTVERHLNTHSESRTYSPCPNNCGFKTKVEDKVSNITRHLEACPNASPGHSNDTSR